MEETYNISPVIKSPTAYNIHISSWYSTDDCLGEDGLHVVITKSMRQPAAIKEKVNQT